MPLVLLLRRIETSSDVVFPLSLLPGSLLPEHDLRLLRLSLRLRTWYVCVVFLRESGGPFFAELSFPPTETVLKFCVVCRRERGGPVLVLVLRCVEVELSFLAPMLSVLWRALRAIRRLFVDFR